MTNPRARSDGLIVEQFDAELLVYDTERDDAHSLDAAAASVWRACDGANSAASIAAATGLAEPAVLATLATLDERHLLQGRTVSRRDVLRAGAVVAAALPVIRSIAVPSAAEAATCLPNGSQCSTNTDCCSANCVGVIPGVPNSGTCN